MTIPALNSPVDLMALAGIAPTSPNLGLVLKAIYGARPTMREWLQWVMTFKESWPKTKARCVAACIGRRGLKTSGILAWCCVFETLCVPHDQYALANSYIYAFVIAPKQVQAREALRYIVAVLDQLAPLGVAYSIRDAAGVPEVEILAPAGRCHRVIRVMTADATQVRGFAVYFAGLEESGHLPSEATLAETSHDLVEAVRPAQLQFPEKLELHTSNPGPPQGVFYDLVTKADKRPAKTLVVKAPTWVMHPNITEAICRADAAAKLESFEQEYECSRWGMKGESFIDSRAAMRCCDDLYTDVAAPADAAVVGLDIGQLKDATGIVRVHSYEVEIAPNVAPVRHGVVERVLQIAADPKNPPPVQAIVGEAVAVAGGAPILFDAFAGPTVKACLINDHGYREHTGDGMPRRRQFKQVSMAPSAQTPRWKLVSALVHGRRLHLRREDEALARELAGLKATELSSGGLRVEGRRDNLADALALALEAAMQRRPFGGPGGNVERRNDGVRWGDDGVTLLNDRWVRKVNGREVRAEWPEWHPGFAEYAQEMLALGVRTPAIDRWLARQNRNPNAA